MAHTIQSNVLAHLFRRGQPAADDIHNLYCVTHRTSPYAQFAWSEIDEPKKSVWMPMAFEFITFLVPLLHRTVCTVEIDDGFGEHYPPSPPSLFNTKGYLYLRRTGRPGSEKRNQMNPRGVCDNKILCNNIWLNVFDNAGGGYGFWGCMGEFGVMFCKPGPTSVWCKRSCTPPPSIFM